VVLRRPRPELLRAVVGVRRRRRRRPRTRRSSSDGRRRRSPTASDGRRDGRRLRGPDDLLRVVARSRPRRARGAAGRVRVVDGSRERRRHGRGLGLGGLSRVRAGASRCVGGPRRAHGRVGGRVPLPRRGRLFFRRLSYDDGRWQAHGHGRRRLRGVRRRDQSCGRFRGLHVQRRGAPRGQGLDPVRLWPPRELFDHVDVAGGSAMPRGRLAEGARGVRGLSPSAMRRRQRRLQGDC